MSADPSTHDAPLERGEVGKQQRSAPRLYPKPGTVRARILAALRAGRSLTSQEALREFGAARMAADAHALRRLGWPVIATEVTVTCREGRRARVAAYSLEAVPGVR